MGGEESERKSGEIIVGTSGYSFEDWIGNFYPPNIKKGEMLTEYAKHFKGVEVNSTYYRIPHPTVLRRMVEKTPEDFEFVIKANQEMTHKQSKDVSIYRQFLDSIEPVVEAGKMSGIIAQFPWGFKRSLENFDHLRFMKDSFSEHPFFVEFRNSEWIRPEVFEKLRENGIGYCAVDEPRLRGLVPPIAEVTTKIGYVRLHGRNAKNWWGGEGDRYDYLYSEEELREWVEKVRAMAKKANKVFVFFNNCHAGQAARNAQLMKQLLSLPF